MNFSSSKVRFPDPEPAAFSEFLGRLILGAALIALFFAVILPFESMAQSNDSNIGIIMLLRISTFVLVAITATMIQGARAKHWMLLIGGIFFVALGASISIFGLSVEFMNLLSRSPSSSGSQLSQHTFSVLLRLEVAALGAILLGTWLARGVTQSGQMLMVVLCAAAGDAWLSILHIPDSIGPGHPLEWLRLVWPTETNGISAAPSLTEVFFLALYLEASRRFKFHLPSIFFGAIAAYTVASFLSFASWQIMFTLPLVGLGVLLGAWPDFRCSAQEVIKAFLAAFLLFALLVVFTYVRILFHPKPNPAPQINRMQEVAELEAIS